MRIKFHNYYKNLSKKKKKLVLENFIFVLFFLGVNIFAWFTYVSKASLEISGTVAAWDVEFNSDGKATSMVVVEITDMKPGMLDYSQQVIVHNLGEVDADLSYEIEKLSILGKDIDVSDNTKTISDLNGFYPFNVVLGTSSGSLDSGKYADFTVNATWSYDEANKYYQLNETYDYDPSYTYYYLNDGVYTEATDITESNFTTKRSSLYLEKDDADTYFGEKCGTYEKASGDACLYMKVKLIAKQKV